MDQRKFYEVGKKAKTEQVSVYLSKKTVEERKDSSPSPELTLAKITPRKAEVRVSESSGEGPLKSTWTTEKPFAILLFNFSTVHNVSLEFWNFFSDPVTQNNDNLLLMN